MKYSPSRLGHPGQGRSLNRLHLPRFADACMGVVTRSSLSRHSSDPGRRIAVCRAPPLLATAHAKWVPAANWRRGGGGPDASN